MNLSEHQNRIINAEICPYCKSKTIKGTESDVYGREYSGKPLIRCAKYPQCDSYVGCHEDGNPLGRLANKELRDYKIRAHNAFDKIWKEKKMDRSKSYQLLSEALNIPAQYTHIGMFSKKTLIKVIAWAKLTYSELV